MSLNWSIDFGNLITISVIFCGLIRMYFADRAKMERFETHQSDTQSKLETLEKRVGAVTEILVSLAKQDERLNAHGDRLSRLEKHWDTLKSE